MVIHYLFRPFIRRHFQEIYVAQHVVDFIERFFDLEKEHIRLL